MDGETAWAFKSEATSSADLRRCAQRCKFSIRGSILS